jgi:hypothetical protein
MELDIKPTHTDISYQVSFSEPMMTLATEAVRLSVVKQISKEFSLRLNDIKFDHNSPSNNYIQFSRFFLNTYLNVSIGLEEITIKINQPENEKQIHWFFDSFFNIVQEAKSSNQRATLSRHFSTDGDVMSYLETINPYTPDGFQSYLDGKGAIFVLKIPEHELTCQILMANSLLTSGGIYLNVDFHFSPTKYNFSELYDIVINNYRTIIDSLNLRVEGGGI